MRGRCDTRCRVSSTCTWHTKKKKRKISGLCTHRSRGAVMHIPSCGHPPTWTCKQSQAHSLHCVVHRRGETLLMICVRAQNHSQTSSRSALSLRAARQTLIPQSYNAVLSSLSPLCLSHSPPLFKFLSARQRQKCIILMTVLSLDYKGGLWQQSRQKGPFILSTAKKTQFGTEGISILQFTRTWWLNGLMYRYLRRPKLSLSAGAAASEGH